MRNFTIAHLINLKVYLTYNNNLLISMYLDEINEILKTFNSRVLKENNVESVTEYCCPEPRTGIILVRYKTREFMIDNEGRICDYKVFSKKEILSWQSYEYDEKGNLTVIKNYVKTKGRINSEWNCRITQLFPEDIITEIANNGNIVESSFYLNGGIKTRKMKDEKGLTIEDKEYKAGVLISDKSFDKEGRVLWQKRFDTNGNSTTERVFEYDERGNMTRYIYKGKNGQKTTDKKMLYDTNNNLVEDVDIPKDVYNILPAIDLDRLANEESNESFRNKYYYDCNQLLFEHQIYLAGQFGVAYEYEYTFTK